MSTTPKRKGSRRRPPRGQTRAALLEAALKLVEDQGSFSSLSLRQVTKRAGVVPTAFYRHFPDMSAMGLTLVEESFSRLRQMMRGIRQEGLPTEQIIRHSVETYFNYVLEHHLHFQFVARELFGGGQAIRSAIRQEIRLFTSELATDLSRFPMLNHISAEDLQMMAGLLVNNMIASTQQMLELSPEAETERADAMVTAEKQMRLIVLGISQWQSQT
jgi:AcrR family transcriptional regulator